MKKHTALWAVLTLLIALPLVAAEEKTDAAAMMPEHTQPGEHHKHLTALAGEYTYTTKIWMEPGAPAMESSGECSRRMVMDGRYLHESFTGDFMGTPFHGMSVTGYDRQKDHYFTMWFDNFGTGVMQATGSCKEGKAWEFAGEHLDPMSGLPGKFRQTTEMVDDDNQIFRMYEVAADGKERLSMEIALTRKGS